MRGLVGTRSGVVDGQQWPIKVVVVTTYQAEDSEPGEFRLWVEREQLDEVLEFPGGVRPLRINAAHDVLGIVTGVSHVHAGASMMALGLDPRFDLSRAYFLVAGLAGVDPLAGAIGSAAWVRSVVGDVAREIDSREAPAEWPYGLFALGAREPNQMPARTLVENLHRLNGGLAEWALGLTRHLALPETAAMREDHAAWVGYPAAMGQPRVFTGESYSADVFWHGAVLTEFARRWVSMWTRGQGRFAMADMEDAAIVEALERLGRMGRVDVRRLMILRVASNYTMQRAGAGKRTGSGDGHGQTAVESVRAGFMDSTALENLWLVGSVVLRAITEGWANLRDRVPGG